MFSNMLIVDAILHPRHATMPRRGKSHGAEDATRKTTAAVLCMCSYSPEHCVRYCVSGVTCVVCRSYILPLCFGVQPRIPECEQQLNWHTHRQRTARGERIMFILNVLQCLKRLVGVDSLALVWVEPMGSLFEKLNTLFMIGRRRCRFF